MSLGKVIRNGVAGALIAAVPITTSAAAVRPSAAVPTAGSTAIAAQYDDDYGAMWGAWLPIAIIIAAILLAIFIASDDNDDDDEVDLSPA